MIRVIYYYLLPLQFATIVLYDRQLFYALPMDRHNVNVYAYCLVGAICN